MGIAHPQMFLKLDLNGAVLHRLINGFRTAYVPTPDGNIVIGEIYSNGDTLW
jgi:hypothetical protein